jgi:hypothetical protein
MPRNGSVSVQTMSFARETGQTTIEAIGHAATTYKGKPSGHPFVSFAFDRTCFRVVAEISPAEARKIAAALVAAADRAEGPIQVIAPIEEEAKAAAVAAAEAANAAAKGGTP